jgi:hypothetical protein
MTRSGQTRSTALAGVLRPDRRRSAAHRVIVLAALTLLSTAWTSSVAAQPEDAPAGTPHYGPPPADPPTAHRHDGFYLRLGIGGGFLLGDVVEEKSSFAISGEAVPGKVTGFAVASELALGGSVAKGLVLGGGIYESTIPNPSYDASFYNGAQLVQASSGGTISGTMVGPFLDWYFDPTAGGHVQVAFGWGFISAAQASGGGAYPRDRDGFGTGAMLGGGYELWVGEQFSLGLLGRLHHFGGKLCDLYCGHENHLTANVIALLLTATYH